MMMMMMMMMMMKRGDLEPVQGYLQSACCPKTRQTLVQVHFMFWLGLYTITLPHFTKFFTFSSKRHVFRKINVTEPNIYVLIFSSTFV